MNHEKNYYVKRYVCGKEQFWNILTGQWMSRLVDECFVLDKDAALYHAAAQAFPGALVYHINHEKAVE
jgi:hypothetical protein